MVSSRLDVLKLYKMLLLEGSKFSSYNFRMYALRRIRSRFQENKNLTDPNEISGFIDEGRRCLEIIKRQVILHDLYKTDKLVIEMKNSTGIPR